MKLENNNDMHIISNEFENGSDRTINGRVIPVDCQDCL